MSDFGKTSLLHEWESYKLDHCKVAKDFNVRQMLERKLYHIFLPYDCRSPL